MQLISFDNPTRFYERVAPYLLLHEAENGLVLGITAALAAGSSEYRLPPYLALVEDGGEIAGVAVRTPPHGLALGRFRDPATADLVAADLAGHASPPWVIGERAVAGAFSQAWQRRTGATPHLIRAERIYQITKVRPPRPASGQFRRAQLADRDLIVSWFRAFQEEALGETPSTETEAEVDDKLRSPDRGIYVWDDNGVVSTASVSRPTPNGISLTWVYTPEEQRGKGYASNIVARLSQAMLDAGRRFCMLFTDLANATSNKIYQAIGYEPVADFDQVGFSG